MNFFHIRQFPPKTAKSAQRGPIPIVDAATAMTANVAFSILFMTVYILVVILGPGPLRAVSRPARVLAIERRRVLRRIELSSDEPFV